MKKSVLKICSLIFGVLSLAGLVVLLCFSITLPHKETYLVWSSVYTQYYPGVFDITYLSSMILLFFGAFWGVVLFFASTCDRCIKENKSSEEEVEPTEGCGSCTPSRPDSEEKTE